ncbi:SurA N-terminal domain-containing protein [Candidatus Woesearchaeota archaeon]|nr:SurA N-terminal domain-containing protein [Candidatus Woesearchaeota archaeon]
MAKKKKAMKKKVNAKKRISDAKGVKIYKVNNVAKKQEARARREKNIQTLLIVLIVILALAAVFSAIQTFFPNLFGKFTLQGELAAVVNGQTITVEHLDKNYERLPLQYQSVITKEDLLGQLIDEVLMMQEASKLGLSVTEEEVDNSIETFMQANNLTQEQLDDILEEKKLTPADFRILLKNQLLIEKLFEQEVKSKINVTTAHALDYYNTNPDTFKVPELVTARHILISTDNRTEEEAEERASTVFKLVNNDTGRFCSYVWLYTDDDGSAETCGKYTFPRGQMVAEFEERAFSQNPGEMSVVKTSFGYHILMTINKTPEQLMSFRDVQEQIILILKNQQEKILYSDFIAGLREQADITNYLEEKAKKEAEAEGAVEEEEIQIVVEEAEQEVEEAEEAVEEEIVELEEEIEELEEELEELEEEVEETIEEIVEEEVVEEVEEEVQIIVEVPEEEVEEEEEVVEEEAEEISPEELEFADCLTAKEAVLYGAYWDSSTKKQKDMFGTDINKITYAECGVQGDYRAQEVACSEAGIMAYPTWVIDEQKHMGILSLEQLSSLSGCPR